MQGMREGQSTAEHHSEEKSTDVEEDIRNLMNKKQKYAEKEVEPELESIETTISLLKQLSLQYDELEAFLRSSKPGTGDQFPVELVSEIVKSSRISPSLCKMVECVTEQVKVLKKENELLKVSETSVRGQFEDATTTHRTVKMEAKYLNKALNEAAKEIKRQKEEASAQRKRIFELEASLESQKKISKELLRDKKVSNKETDIHEEEKQVLQGIIEHKDAELEKARRSQEEMSYEKQKIKREHEVLLIQYSRLKKRAEIKEKALNACTLEMEELIKQMDKLSKSDLQKRERLEYLAINKKKKEYDAQKMQTEGERRRRDKRSEIYASRNAPARSSGAHKPREVAHSVVVTDETEETDVSGLGSESITDIPVSFSQAVDDASVSDVESNSTNKTTTSFREMQKKTEEMTKKFKELENLLNEIKKTNDSELDKVEEKISRRRPGE
ncbi:uncharacterized protein NEMAJ01_0983 [Nematocida major]|uniref:uncharacterized protein n=1 Tax=Nematocida major TaxID=1912982 RepID=UPI0020084811|nr:uncharacterized protein NEMAJ01_0983 [Nematocida major]KAH9386087.1 hypothetical protein NEMAJ01_0983 [Nematocida major]